MEAKKRDNLIQDLRALLKKHYNGIWLKELSRKYAMLHGYQLVPEKYGFENLLDLSSGLKNVFHVKKYDAEDDFLLSDARYYRRAPGNNCGEIPKPVIIELINLMKTNKASIYTDTLLEEYQKMYQRKLQPSSFGFSNMDAFLQSLASSCPEFYFSRVGLRHIITLIHAQSDVKDSIPHKREVLQTDVAFPPDVCNADYQFERYPRFNLFAEAKEGTTFEIQLQEVFSPGKFYIMPLTKVNLFDNMMSDLNETYSSFEKQYKILPSLVSPNLLCACQYSKNSKWHRVRVTCCADPNEVKIVYIDYGTNETISLEKLRYLHKDFGKFPSFCMQSGLSGIQPNDCVDYQDSLCLKFTRYIENCDLEVEVVKTLPERLEVLLYIIETDGTRTSVREKLLKRHLVGLKIDENVSSSLISSMSDDASKGKTSSIPDSSSESSVPAEVLVEQNYEAFLEEVTEIPPEVPSPAPSLHSTPDHKSLIPDFPPPYSESDLNYNFASMMAPNFSPMNAYMPSPSHAYYPNFPMPYVHSVPYSNQLPVTNPYLTSLGLELDTTWSNVYPSPSMNAAACKSSKNETESFLEKSSTTSEKFEKVDSASPLPWRKEELTKLVREEVRKALLDSSGKTLEKQTMTLKDCLKVGVDTEKTHDRHDLTDSESDHFSQIRAFVRSRKK